MTSGSPELADLVGADTVGVVVAAGVILVWALILGVWKYHGMRTSPDHSAHVYVDIAHRAALMYAFATLLLAALVELSEFPTVVNVVAAAVPIVFFVGAVAAYCVHGALRDTTNQFADPTPGTHAFMLALIGGEIGGVVVLLVGVAARWF
jgi:hypothetical protein